MIRVVAIVGSYRRGGMIDSAVDAVLEGARQQGAETEKIYLLDKHIEFCTNCRKCTQEGGRLRGRCEIQDDMDDLLKEIEGADAVVLGAPVNFFNVTAIFRRFMERLLGYAYWPWGSDMGPVQRNQVRPRKAILLTSAAMPKMLIPLATGAPRALKVTARMLGAKPVGHLWIGLVPAEPRPALRPEIRAQAEKLGLRLARAA